MVKIIYFNIAALAVLAIMIVSSIYRGMTKGRANIGFMLAMTVVFMTSLFGTAAIAFDNIGAGYVVEKWIFHAGYLLFHTLTSAFYLWYLISLTDTWHKLRKSSGFAAALISPAIILFATLAVNAFFPVVFYIDSVTDVYTRGPIFAVTYAVGAYYLIFGIYYVFRYRRLFTLRWIFTLFAPYPAILISMIVEFLYPYIVIELFVNALALLFVQTIIQRPEELVDPVTGLGNSISVELACRKALLNKKPLIVIITHTVNFGMLRDALGFERQMNLRREIADGLVRLAKSLGAHVRLYSSNEGRHYILIEERSFGIANRLADGVLALTNSSFTFGDVQISPTTSVASVRLPEDIRDFDTLVTFGYNFDRRAEAGRLFFANNLIRDSYFNILLNIDRIIQNALVHRRFEMYYQPIYSVSEGKFRSAEALIRLKDEKYGFVSPDLFIPAAERNGAIYSIGEFVLEEVAAFIASDEFATTGVDFIDVNLSVAQCMQNNLAQQVSAVISRHNISSAKINLEITETAVSKSPKRLAENLAALTEAGFDISLDDFGSGYSNIRRIAELPVAVVKFDKSFVSDRNNEKSEVMLESLVSMIRALDMSIVVEGVETSEDALRFTELGCEFIQGYYYAKPLPKNDFIAFVRGKNAEYDGVHTKKQPDS